MAALLSPPILFFVLGLIATALRTGLRIPHPIPKLLSLYLLFAIGFKGGVELRAGGIDSTVVFTLLAATASAALFPLVTFFILKRRLPIADAGAIAATYGSVSAVTFMTAVAVLNSRGIEFSGHMVAAMALMESPAIVVSVALIRRFQSASTGEARATNWKALLHESFLNGPVFLLLGSMLVGVITGAEGEASLKPFSRDVFNGVLCFFLLDLGLLAARKLQDLKEAGAFLVGFAIIAPVVQAAVGLGMARLLGLDAGDSFLLAILCGSASYLAVPATMRLVLPEARATIFVPMALGVTFPFNVSIAIPLYLWILERWW